MIGSSNSALNVEEEAEKSVKVQTREEKKTRDANAKFWHILITFPADLTGSKTWF